MTKICIIGCGASGLAAAVTASEALPGEEILILERNPVPGKKLLATGNGRCNLGNLSCENLPEVFRFFHAAGIVTRADAEGRLYPASGRAADVLDALLQILAWRHVKLRTNAEVTEIQKYPGGFRVKVSGEFIQCEKLLLATGGKAGPQFGSIGDGYRFARALGHPVTRTWPVLSPVTCENHPAGLKGIRAAAKATLLHQGKPVFVEAGEIQFMEDGLSGICIFNLTGEIKLPEGRPYDESIRGYEISVDLVPDMELSLLRELISQRMQRFDGSLNRLMLTMIHPALAEELEKQLRKQGDMTGEGISQKLKDMRFQITGIKGWKQSQCTAGGVLEEQVFEETMESKLVPGLYFAGELLEYAGPCGGYNLHHAWQSGLRAGKAMTDDTI